MNGSALAPRQSTAPPHPLEAVTRCLAHLGVHVPPTRIAVDPGGSDGLRSVARALAHHGVAASAVSVTAEDVPFLRTPAVLELTGGELVTLRAVEGGRAVVEGSDGAVRHLAQAELATILGSSALEVGVSPGTDERGLRRLVTTLGSSPRLRRALAHAVALAFLQGALTMTAPLLTARVLTVVIPTRAVSTLAVVVAAFAAVTIQQVLLGLVRLRAMRYLRTAAHLEGEARTFHGILSLPFAVAEREGPGKLATALIAAASVPGLALEQIAFPALDALFCLLYVSVCGGDLAFASTAVVVAFLLCAISSVVAAHVCARHERKRTSAAARQEAILFELLSGVSTLRAAGAERRVTAGWLGELVDELHADMGARLAAATHGHVVDAVSALLSAALLLWGAYACLHGDVPLGPMVASLQACAALWGALRRALSVPAAIGVLREQARRADEPLEDPRRAIFGRGRARMAQHRPGEDAIVADDLWFRHDPDGPWLFQGLDLRFPAGRASTLSWPSGRGKTTLLRLLAGLLVPERGSLTIFGLDASKARDLVFYLPQSPVLFTGSIRHNLRILSGDAPLDRLLEAAAETGLIDLLKSWPMGLETIVTQNGGNLSTGQKQLVLLTAAIASDRPVLLMDESTAHLDRLTRARVEACRALRGRTIITVVHDLAPGAPKEETPWRP